MDRFKSLKDDELKEINAGSNDLVWFGVGYCAGVWWKTNASYNAALRQARGW